MLTAQVSLEQVAAHYAINSLFATYTRDLRVYCYSAKQLDYQMRRMGSLTLAVGHLQLISEFTRECKEFVFAVLHLGSWDFRCCIEPFKGRRFYSELHYSEPGAIEAEIHNVERASDLGERLDIGLSVTRAQEVYLQGLESHIVPLCLGGIQRLNNNVSVSDEEALNSCLLPEKQWQLPQIRKLLFLGKKLAIEVDGWLSQL